MSRAQGANGSDCTPIAEKERLTSGTKRRPAHTSICAGALAAVVSVIAVATIGKRRSGCTAGIRVL